MTQTEWKDGWAFPQGSRKAHYITKAGRSLCGGYGFYSGSTEQDNDDSADNCAKCKRERSKLVTEKGGK